MELVYYEERPDGWHPVVVTMTQAKELADNTHLYRAVIPAHLRHVAHFHVRVHPISANFARSFELPLVTRW
ncbi:hypothetical protein D3C73_1489320 [compost metagenome]